MSRLSPVSLSPDIADIVYKRMGSFRCAWCQDPLLPLTYGDGTKAILMCPCDKPKEKQK